MSIIGIGVDIVNNDRLKKLVKKKNFIKRIFTINEQIRSKKLKNRINYYSKRYAAKEAFSKATGFGISKNLHFKDIEIKSNKRGKPLINLETIINLISHTTTKKGLEVMAVLDENIYQKGIQVDDETMDLISISRDPTFPLWNYSISPNTVNFI